MENYIKPDWLIEAEEAIKEFEQTEWGSLTQSEFNQKMGLINGGKTSGQKSVESGRIYKMATKEDCVKGGKIAGKKCAENGHLDKIRTKENCIKGGKIAGQKAIKSGQIKNLGDYYGKIQGKKNAENGHIQRLAKECGKKLRKLTFEQAEEIRSLYKTGNYSYRKLAQMFNVPLRSISLIVTNKGYLEP